MKDQGLELAIIGNCNIAALVDTTGGIVWACLPRFDGDPVYCSLLDGGANGRGDGEGSFRIELSNYARAEQEYLANTAVLVTRLYDENGGALEIVDFAPRYARFGRHFRPTMLVREVRPMAGTPRIRIVHAPRFEYGAVAPKITHGSNHIRYVGPSFTLRLYTEAPLAYVMDQSQFLLEKPITLMVGADESLAAPIAETGREFKERTCEYWRGWVQGLAIPAEWQDAVIRSAITLKLCNFEETGAIIAAVTTSIPEAADSGRTWDYRFCWLRDAFFVVRALNRLGAVTTMEGYVRYVLNIVSANGGGHLQPVYGIGLETDLEERELSSLAGYRGMGPVRVGNQAHRHFQHDVYGNVVLALIQAFMDRRLAAPAGVKEFESLEWLGDKAFEAHNQPDAGMWEFRSRSRIHTSSSLMCWAAMDRLAKIALHLGLSGRAAHWRDKAEVVRAAIDESAWNPELGSFAESFGGKDIDGGLLLMAKVGYLAPGDPRFEATVRAIEKALRRGDHLMRYREKDDFGRPKSAFTAITFWFIEALAVLGHTGEAREIFERVLECRNALGLMSEDINPETGELWGNFPQTYSQVGIINCAMRLSRKWEEIV